MNQSNLQQLGKLLQVPVALRALQPAEWVRLGGRQYPAVGEALQFDRSCLVVMRSGGKELQCLEVAARLTPVELQLLVWAAQQGEARQQTAASELERQARRLGEWIQQAVAGGEWGAEIPERMELRGRLFDGSVPFLLVREQPDNKEPSYSELEKMARSFLTEDTLLIPLRGHEWLILSSDTVLAEADTEGEETSGREEIKEVLATLAEGLHELVTGEWGGECHVAVGEAIVAAESIVRTVGTLRETVNLGRKFHVGMQIHLPWLVHLERLLSGIPEQVRLRFVEEMMGRPDLFTDAETVTTLDAFFAMDCNVSETAKKLFIHRNTLLYRLDKIRSEAGLDVRSFNDALLVRIMLLLYKVTKRK